MSLKKTFSKDKKTCSVTFTVSAEAAQGAKKVNLAGDFNWKADKYIPAPYSNADNSVVVTKNLK